VLVGANLCVRPKIRYNQDKYKGSFLEEALTPECGDEFKRLLQRFRVKVQTEPSPE